MNYLYEDVEFTNFSTEKGDLLQLSLIAEVNGETFTFNEYARPINRNGWSVQAEKVHGISWIRSQEFQPIEKLAEKLKIFLDQFDCVFTMVGWNCATDKKYIDKLIRKYALKSKYYYKIRPEWVDVIKLVRDRKSQIKCKDLKLKTVSDYFKVKIDAHDAMSDANATMEIFKLVKMMNNDNCDFKQISIEKNMSEVEKRQRFMRYEYVQVSGGDVFITKKATQSKEALRVIFSELWDLFS